MTTARTPNIVHSTLCHIGMFMASIAAASAATVDVDNREQLVAAVASANNSGGNTMIRLGDGTYTLNDTLYITAPRIALVGRSGARDRVVIQGDAMSSSARVKNLIRVGASNFEIRHITLQKSGWHLIQIAGEDDADFPVIRDCILRDAYQQLVKVSYDAARPSVSSDNGLVENCLFEYSAGIGPQYYIGGIDAHASKGWVVRKNTFRHIISPSGSVAEFAVHFWNGSANNLVERNLIVNCDRGIGFGLDSRGNTGGIIRNNMIYHAGNAGAFADTGIAVAQSPGTQIYNNTVFLESAFPWAIESRFASTTDVLIANNLTNKPIIHRDGASGSITHNVTNASGTWFVNLGGADLHLASAIGSVTGAGIAIAGLADDFDGQPRPVGNIDIGADQRNTNLALPAPTNLRINP